MNIFKHSPQRSALVLVASLAITASAQAQTATWNNVAADNNWNTAGNWDVGTPLEGTNAIISAGFTVNYIAPMVAGSFNGLTASSPVNINAAGFTSSANWTISGAAARLNVNSGGVAAVTNGSLTFTLNGGGTLASGGSLSLQSQLNMGTTGAGNNGFFTNNGGTLSAITTRINPNNLSSSSVLIINGGTSDLGAVSMNRSAASSFQAIGAEGLVISNGLVRMTSLNVGGTAANSHLSCILVNGTVTNTGAFAINQATSARAARFLQLGGLFVSTDPVGARVGFTNAGTIAIYSVLGGTNIAERLVLGDYTNNSATVNLTNAAKIYLGSGGMVSNLVQTVNVSLNTGGTFGANADWTSTVPMILAGGAFDCADLAGVSHNITISNALRSTGQLIKNGSGTLTLSAANSYSGNTVINAGTLALGAAGSIASSPQIAVGSGTAFDVSAVSGGYTLPSARTLTGAGTVNGAVSLASGAIINPANTLTFSGSVTETGGAINHFDLPTTPGPGNDLMVIGGDLNASGVNFMEIVGGGSPGTVHTLIQYVGTFNGTLANFSITGATGTLSNNPTSKTISLIIASTVRNPTNVIWLGNVSVNDWDTVNRTNWQNTGTGLLDYFVAGDNALFSNTGAANPIVNIVGNNAPATLTVGASANYTFGGSGAISGNASLTKTNTGTLTITNANTYIGVTTISGGVLEAGNIANGGSPSAIGAANSSAANLVLDGGTLRYSGASVSTDRAATLNAGGGVVDVTSAATTLTMNGSSVGAGALTKSGAGTLVLSVANTYAGGTIISNGTVHLNIAGAAGTGGVTNYGGVIRGPNSTVTIVNVIDVNGNCTIDAANSAGDFHLTGAWSGSGTINVINFPTAARTLTLGGGGNGGGSMTAFTGTINLGTSGGHLRFNDGGGNNNLGNPAMTLDMGTGAGDFNVRNGGVTVQFGALSGGSATTISGRASGASGTVTYSIGALNLPTTFAGNIRNGANGTALTKVGTASLTLTGTNTYTGVTVVNDGTLQVDGALSGTTSVTVIGGKLSGNGSINGVVDIQTGATLSPGASIGKLTMTGNLTLQLGSTNLMEINKTAGTNDAVIGLANVTFGGTLVVNNLAGTLADGDSFKLFDSASYAGAYDTLALPALGAFLFWDTSKLTVDGTIRVFTPRPGVTSFGISGSNFFLTGTNNGNTSTHYIVITSTNVAAPQASWTPVVTNLFDGGGNLAFTNVVNLAEPQRFYNVKTP